MALQIGRPMSQLQRLFVACTAGLARRPIALAVAVVATAAVADPCRREDCFRTTDIVSAAAVVVGCFVGRCFGRTATRSMVMTALRHTVRFVGNHSPAVCWHQLFPSETSLLATAEDKRVVYTARLTLERRIDWTAG